MKDLVCTICDKKYVTLPNDDLIALMEPGHCNEKLVSVTDEKTCMGKLEWRDSK